MPIALSALRRPITRTIFHVSDVVGSKGASATSHARNSSDSVDNADIVNAPVTTMDLLIPLLLVVLPFLLAFRRRGKNILALKAKKADAAYLVEHEADFWNVWMTREMPVLYGLTELYITGKFPLGPWDVFSVRAWMAKYDKHYMRRLCRAGIVPLYIQDSGMGTRKWPSVDEDTSRDTDARYSAVKKFGSKKTTDEGPGVVPGSPWEGFKIWWDRVLDIWLPRYIQSKRRAYFDFLIPVPLDYDPNGNVLSVQHEFVRRLFIGVGANAGAFRDFAVSIWVSGLSDGIATMVNDVDPDIALEYGATSHFKTLLPFKKDRVLREGTKWAEQLRMETRRRLIDPLSTPVEKEELGHRHEELTHDVHYYMKKGSIPVLEVPPLTSTTRVAIIRVEKRDGLEPGVRLVQFVAQAAWDAGLCHRFGEQAIMGRTRSWLDEKGLGDLQGIQQFLFTPTRTKTSTPRRQAARAVRSATPTPQEMLSRSAIQQSKFDKILERSRVAREMRQENEEQRKQRVEREQDRIESDDVLDRGLEDEDFEDFLDQGNVPRDGSHDENESGHGEYDSDL